MRRYQPGDRVTLRRGKKVSTDLTPGEADLAGVQCVVVDEPLRRVGSCDGRERDRVTVRPLIPNAFGGPKFGLPLDVPVDNMSREAQSGYFAGLGGAVKDLGRAIMGRGAGEKKLRSGERSTHVYRGGRMVCIDSDDQDEVEDQE